MATVATYTQPAYDSIEEGWYGAKIIQSIALGSQRFEKNGKEWYSPMVMLGFELPSITFENKEGEQLTKVMSMMLFLSLNPAGKGRVGLGEIISALGIEAEEFDVEQLVGKTCEVFIQSVESKGREYTNITNVRKTDEKVVGSRQTLIISVSDFSNEIVIGSLPEWIQEKLYRSKEMQELQRQPATSADFKEDVRVEDVPFN